jgi:hypothetical protein
MLSFQQYQLDFTAHIRNPAHHKKPAKIVAERMAVYRHAVFNNIAESVSVCFPICQKVHGKRAWHRLIRGFVMHHQSTSPIFREIPKQFLDYLNSVTNTPPYLQSLAHYEWVELAVGALETSPHTFSKTTNLIDEVPVLAPASMLLHYDYPVHKISARYKPTTLEPTYLLVFRNSKYEVKFIELNPMTYCLLSLIQEQNFTGRQALTKLALEINHPETESIIQFGTTILNDLAEQEAIIGSAKNKAKLVIS